MDADRTPGSPLPGELIKQLRKKAGLSQEGFAESLGLRGGKATVYGWETSRTSCEGPVAELIVLLYGEAAEVLAHPFRRAGERIWTRGGASLDRWREVVIMPDRPLAMETASLREAHDVRLVAAMLDQFDFPWFSIAGRSVAGLTPDGWVAALPPDSDVSPRYMWQLDRHGFFRYREPLWEAGARSVIPEGISVKSQLEIALRGTCFYGRFAAKTGMDTDGDVALQLGLSGVAGRGFVMPEASIFATPPVFHRWLEDGLRVRIRRTVGQLAEDPVGCGVDVVAELVSMVDPDSGAVEALVQSLGRCLKEDRDLSARRRELAFLDSEDLPESSRARLPPR